MAFGPISLDTTPTATQDPISIDTGKNDTVVSDTSAMSRAPKYEFGVGSQVGKNTEQIRQDLVNGKEGQLRQQVAANQDRAKVQAMSSALGKGLPFNMDTVQDIMERKSDPSVVLEQHFAKQYTNFLDTLAPDDSSWIKDAQAEMPEHVEKAKEMGADAIAKREIALRLYQDSKETYENQSTGSWAWDQAKAFAIPGYFDMSLRGRVKDVPFLEGFRGTNVQEQIQSLLSQPIEEYSSNLKQISQDIAKHDPGMSVYFLEQVLGQSTDSKNLDNLFSAVDLTVSGGLVKSTVGLARKAFLYNSVQGAMKNLVKSSEAVGEQPVKVAAAAGAGKLDEAAIQKTTTDTVAKLSGRSKAITKDAVQALHDIMRPDISIPEGSNPGRFGQEATNQLGATIDKWQYELTNLITNIIKVERIPGAVATEKAIRAIKDEIRGNYPGLSNQILNISDPFKNALTNTWHYDVTIGKPGAEYFARYEQAKTFREVAGLQGMSIESKNAGTGFYLKATRPLDEEMSSVRDFLLKTADSTTPYSWVNSWLSWIRTPEETMSKDARMARKIVDHAPSILEKFAQDTAKDIKKLAKYTLPGTKRKERWDNWERVVKALREEPDENGQPGKFLNSPGEFEDYYQNIFHTVPDAQQVRAYFSYKKFMHLDWTLRNLSMYKNMSRVGTEEHVFRTIGEDGKLFASPKINGILQKDFPGGEDTIMVVGDKVGDEAFFRGGQAPTMSPQRMEQLKEEVKTGRKKVIRIYDPEQRPLQSYANVGDKRVRYIIADNVETKPLSYEQLSKRGGGHFDYDYEHYIKQARIIPENIDGVFKHWYEGDSTVMPISNRAMGRRVAQHMDNAREFIRLGKMKEAEAYVGAHLPMDWKEFKGWFEPTTRDGVKIPARLNMNEKFQVVPKNSLIIDMDNNLPSKYPKTFKDGSRQGSDARQFQVQYTGQRDAYEVNTIRDEGNKNKPLYKYEPAQMVDPIPSMNRAMSRIINSQWADDYKISAMEHWIKEAGKYLNVDDVKELEAAPFYHFFKGEFKSGAEKEEAGKISQLKSNRFKIKQFTGIQNVTDTFLHSMSQKLADMVYEKAGPKGDIIPTWLLAHTKDPFRFTRSVVFNEKMGFFNIPQFFVHMSTMGNLSIAGIRNPVAGTVAAAMHGLTRLNKDPAIVNRLGEITEHFGWKPGMFKEAMEEVAKTGFMNEHGEHALRDDVFQPQVFKSSAGDFLHAGQMFFRGGVRSLRAASYYTAFKEIRDLHPMGPLTDNLRMQILERASILSHNMSRSSSSILHTGIMSFPMQFATYGLRLTELMTGSRLTWQEKTRLFAANSLLYGFPAAAGLYGAFEPIYAAVTGSPFEESIRDYARDHPDPVTGKSYVVGDNFFKSFIMEGGLSAMGAIVDGSLHTGHIDWSGSHGDWLNFGPRYGPASMKNVVEMLNKDQTIFNIFGGAAAGTISNTWAQSSGLRMALSQLMTGKFPLKTADFLDPLKEISAVNQVFKTMAGMHYGAWLSKTETQLDSVSPTRAFIRGVTGLQPVEDVDLYSLSISKQAEDKYQKTIIKKFGLEMQRAVRANADGNTSQRDDYLKRAAAWVELGGFPLDRYKELYRNSIKGIDNSLLESQYWNSFLKNVPAGKEQERLDHVRRQLQRNQERK